MTMTFPVKDPQILEGVNPGNEIEGELVVAKRESYLCRLKVTRRAESPPKPES